MFQHRQLDAAVGTGHTDCSHKIPDCFRRVSTTTKSGQCRHAWVIPAVYVAFLDELAEFALAHHGVGQAETIEFNLLRWEYPQLLDEPAVDRLVIRELERTHRVGYLLQRIRLAVGVVVHRIDAPLAAGAVMLRMQDAVHHWVAHV